MDLTQLKRNRNLLFWSLHVLGWSAYGIAQYLGSADRDLSMRLFVTPSEKRAAETILTRAGLDASLDRPAATVTLERWK